MREGFCSIFQDFLAKVVDMSGSISFNEAEDPEQFLSR